MAFALVDVSFISRRCINNIDHSFDGTGMEITSELHLTNLGHTDIGKYQCVVENKFGATYSNKAKITVYVFSRGEFLKL